MVEEEVDVSVNYFSRNKQLFYSISQYEELVTEFSHLDRDNLPYSAHITSFENNLADAMRQASSCKDF